MIVLDTHALLWVLGDSPRLGHRAAATAMAHHAKVMTADARLLHSRVVATIDARR